MTKTQQLQPRCNVWRRNYVAPRHRRRRRRRYLLLHRDHKTSEPPRHGNMSGVHVAHLRAHISLRMPQAPPALPLQHACPCATLFMPSTAAPWCCTARALHRCLCRAPWHAHRALVLGSRRLGCARTHATHTLV
eukprot:6734816-Alexandrium_andersonii.AAC.1